MASEFKSIKRSSISLLVSEGPEEGLSINIDIQFSKVFSLWDPQDSIKCLHLFKELYFSRSDKVPSKLSLKRCRHLIESWGSQRLKTLENCISILIDNPSSCSSETNKEIDDLFKDLNSDAIKFQELYYLERQHINFLDKQRCGNFMAS